VVEVNIGEDEDTRIIRRIEPFEIPGEPTAPAPAEPVIEPEPVTVPA